MTISTKHPFSWKSLVLFLLLCVMQGSLLAAFSPFLNGPDFWKGVIGILLFAFMGALWKTAGILLLIAMILSRLGIMLYAGNMSNMETAFFLKYLLSSPSALVWMSFCFLLSFAGASLFFIQPKSFIQSFFRFNCFIGIVFGLILLIMRGYEGYLIGPDIGHLPIVSLYEVLVLLVISTALLFTWFDQRYNLKGVAFLLLGMIMLMIVGIGLKAFQGSDIQPLVPALQSSWMKLHVPTSFIGYAAFSLAAACGGAIWLQHSFGCDRFLPDRHQLAHIMSRCVMIGFLFFSIGIMTGSLWAAEAWGTYWQWDPKETWALIVWLNYAAWLHWRPKQKQILISATWAIVGWGLSLFAFIGVNLWLPGLHSYAG